MNPQSLVSDVRREIVETTAAFWADAEIHNYMTQAEAILADTVNCTEARDVSLSGVTDQSAYTLPTNCMNITRLTYDKVKLKKISFEERDMLNGTSYGDTFTKGLPEYYVEYNDEVILYPPPDTSTKEIEVYFNKRPSRITTASTKFTINDRYEHIQVYAKDYCLYRMYKKDDDMQKAQFHYQIWEDNIGKSKRVWDERLNWDRFPSVLDVNDYNDTQMGPI